jgi:copper chaperone CopZ
MNSRTIGILLIISCLCFSFTSSGQFKEVEIGVNGLTCSQCSRTVEMQIRKLGFVKDVDMNLEHTEGKIFFKNQKKVDVNKIAKAVKDAGFSVRSLEAQFSFDHVNISPGYCFDYGGDKYQFVNVQQKTLNGSVTLKFIGKDFLPKKDYKKWEQTLKSNCSNNSAQTYYVTM